MQTETIAKNESCKITLCSNDFQNMIGYKHEVHDTERGELLSQWEDSKKLLNRLQEVDHRLASEFKEWVGNNE